VAPKLARHFDADSCFLTARNGASGQSLITASTANFTPDITSEYVNYYRFTDLWLASGLRLPKGVPNLGQELVDDDVLLKSEFYNDYLKPRLSHFDMLGGMMPLGDGREGFVAVHRPRGAARFDEADKRSLAILLPHIIQAMRLTQRLAGAHQVGVIATAALDAMPTGVAAVSSERNVLFANNTAEKLLSAGQGLTVCHGQSKRPAPISPSTSASISICNTASATLRRKSPSPAFCISSASAILSSVIGFLLGSS
jgi:hypothetical protein